MLNKSITRAYSRAQQLGYDAIYWALDLHGTCIVSNYNSRSYEWINSHCKDALQYLSEQKETKIIIWSSLHEHEIPFVLDFFREHGINIYAVNQNPLEKNTDTGCFDQKFYMSIIVDDKAGFDPDEWPIVVENVRNAKSSFGFI